MPHGAAQAYFDNVRTSLALVAGVALALALVRITSPMRRERARRIYAVGLLIAAVIYVVFAAFGGADSSALALEAIGVLIYGGAAYIGLKRWPLALALGWATHVAWDVLLHVNGPGADYTPKPYPWICLTFDLAIAGAILRERTVVGQFDWSKTTRASRKS